ncbi:MAG: SH3 domain-containing protein [Chloroflexi bacterium]|nr:SH3 domain-containing protein [Chloroflexota bacterium]
MRRRHLLRTSAALGLAALLPRAAGAQTALTAGTQGVITTDQVNVHGGPGQTQPVVGTLDTDASVDLLGASSDGQWLRIASTTSVGYVSAQFLQPTGQPISSGVFDLDLPVPYARQLSDIWCDPADIEMWMSYRQGRASTGGTASLQSSIWDWETSHNAGFTVDQWDCSPFAVASALHRWLPDSGFDHFQFDDPMAGSRLIAWLLANAGWREPSIALIWRGLHYVLVRGVRAVGDPGQDPAGAQLLGFYVADPDPGASFWLGQDRFIPIDRWVGELFSPVSYQTPHTGVPGDVWQNRMVAIQRASTGGGPTQNGQRNATSASYT